MVSFFNAYEKHATLTLTNPMCWTNGVSTMSDKTIKELADELNVSKQTVQYHVKFLPTKYLSKNDKKIITINKTGQSYLKGKIKKRVDKNNEQKTNKETTNYTAKNDQLFKQQLEIKDKQIEELQKLLHSQQKLLDQQQILTLQANKKIETLEYNSEKKEEEKPTKNNEKRNWFSRVFK